MLATILKTSVAESVSIAIMDAFVSMKKYISNELLEQQYIKNMLLKYDNTFHDRYIIIDKEKVYHCGSSINHIGNKTFSINILQEKEIITSLLDKIKNRI